VLLLECRQQDADGLGFPFSASISTYRVFHARYRAGRLSQARVLSRTTNSGLILTIFGAFFDDFRVCGPIIPNRISAACSPV
jgi:hypothetical protein